MGPDAGTSLLEDKRVVSLTARDTSIERNLNNADFGAFQTKLDGTGRGVPICRFCMAIGRGPDSPGWTPTAGSAPGGWPALACLPTGIVRIPLRSQRRIWVTCFYGGGVIQPLRNKPGLLPAWRAAGLVTGGSRGAADNR